MENKKNKSTFNTSDAEMNIYDFLKILWHGKLIILTSIIIFFMTSIFYAFSLPNIYQSKALLSPASDQNYSESALRGYSGLASFAGISVGANLGNNNSLKALKKLNSLNFFSDNIMPNIFLPDLMSYESWEPISNTNVYDENIYDIKTQTWVREHKFPMSLIPSKQESFEKFINEHLRFSEDKNNGFVTISINHQSPFIAKAWVEVIVEELNNYFRIYDEAEAHSSVNYLKTQISETGLTEIKVVIAQLLQQKIQVLTLIQANDYYVFEYLDRPVVMEQKLEPNRIIIMIIGIVFGIIFGTLVTFVKYLYSKKIR